MRFIVKARCENGALWVDDDGAARCASPLQAIILILLILLILILLILILPILIIMVLYI